MLLPSLLLSPRSTRLPLRDLNGRGKACSWDTPSLLFLHPTSISSSLLLPSVEAGNGQDWKAYIYRVTLVLHSYIQPGWQRGAISSLCVGNVSLLILLWGLVCVLLPSSWYRRCILGGPLPSQPPSLVVSSTDFAPVDLLQVTGPLRWDGRLMKWPKWSTQVLSI